MIGGTIPALLTPFTPGGAEVDLDAMDEHVAWLHERGVRCVSPMGTTGEGPSLALEERRRIVDRLSRHPSGMTLLTGTGCTNLPETIELSRYAVERGSAGLLVAPPSFYPPTTAGTTRFFTALLEALPAETRVFVYHIPSHTGVPVEDETLRALGERFAPMLAGAKDSGGDFAHSRRWMRDFRELTILPGSDVSVADTYEAGGRGTITLLANVVPEELEAIRAGDDVQARQRFLTELRDLVGGLTRHAALKHLLRLVSGLPRSAVRPPLEELDAEAIDLLESRYTTLKGETLHV